ncbi:hypothetical protein DPMN_068324 [Dreissena polymorpha]|uniref:Uncharacterized protein n=1 Tax=Dreissena polymorpha TaxID=45954 RepID=A0A9D3Z1G2_DREPO|nr:hypothetical protein DPMN_068324 [Dreissena polymorpha]
MNWQGFEDPQSEIDHFEVCVSTLNEYCDVLQKSNCLLHSSIIKSNMTLPRNTELVATVWAFNRVGMNVSKTSDMFVIDDSPPVVRRSPTFLLTYNAAHGKYAQWEKSIIRLEWEFTDDRSPIVRHEITLKTHHEGHTPVEHLILGSERHVTISLDGKSWLNDGDKYYAVVTSCNAAGLCSSDRTPDLLIDSSPPHLGGFKPPMTWANYNDSDDNLITNLNVTWYGFLDQESGIENFYITVSRYYGLHELSNGLITFPNGNKSEEIQASIALSKTFLAGDRIVLSIWAQNNVGLNSSISRITVNVISSTANSGYGILEIEKHSCDVHFCNKDCTCAVIGLPCVEVMTNMKCSNMSYADAISRKLPVFNVYAGLPHEVLNISASSACLSGHWSRIDGGIVSENIRRFEWSIGIFNHSVGEGIYDLQLENPWTDIGLRSEFIHCLPINRTFIHETEYVVYVRAWFEANEYAMFESSPIMIDQTGPSVRRGRYIREGNCIQDLDFIDWSDSIIACWDGVFIEQQSRIDHFSVSFGTSPHSNNTIRSF